MPTKRISEKMRAASATDKFSAAERAMANGGLVVPNDEPKAGDRLTRATATRESLTLLPDESLLIDTIRRRVAGAGDIPNRSEVLRAGILSLNALTDKQLAEAIANVPKLKPGRISK